MKGRETRSVGLTTSGGAWSTPRRSEAKLTTVGKTARRQAKSKEGCDEEL
jgi:hypothetical protein